jgi:hypothetical protein
MAERTFRSMLAELRSLGGIGVAEAQGLGLAIPYRDALILSDHNSPITEASPNAAVNTCASIYCVDVEEGVNGLFSTDASGDYKGRTYGGLYIRSVGELEDSDHERTRLTWYASIVHKATPGLVRLSGITN